MRRIFGGLLLSVALMAPLAMQAEQRYYDRDRKDYHEWNEGERKAYKHWLEAERKAKYHDWKKANKREREEYWRWRHDHADWDRH